MAIPVAARGDSSTASAATAFPGASRHDFHGKQAAVELIVRVLACLAEGFGIRATARVVRLSYHLGKIVR